MCKIMEGIVMLLVSTFQTFQKVDKLDLDTLRSIFLIKLKLIDNLESQLKVFRFFKLQDVKLRIVYISITKTLRLCQIKNAKVFLRISTNTDFHRRSLLFMLILDTDANQFRRGLRDLRFTIFFVFVMF